MVLAFQEEQCPLTHLQIKVANKIGLPFLAVTGTHGWTDDISKIQDGIQIRMRGLNHIELGPNNDTAYAGGGVIQYEVVQGLYPFGKQAGAILCSLLYRCTSKPEPTS